MLEYSFLKEKKNNMEFITPQKLRDFIKNKVGDCKDKVIFDCAVGSGQLLFNIEARKKIGFDINEKAIEAAVKNGIEAKVQDYILYNDNDLQYDYIISNYPYSLKANEEQNKYLCLKYGLKKYTGVLDKEFILKSFRKAQKGFYLCFPGICYRKQEKVFRQYLIDNNYIEEIGRMKNTGFNDTTIDILYLQLYKYKTNDKIKVFETDNYITTFEKEITNKDVKNIDYNLSTNKWKPEEKIDILNGKSIIDINKEVYNHMLKELKYNLELQLFLKKNFQEDMNWLTLKKIRKDLFNIYKGLNE